MLKPGFRHVFCARQDSSGIWICFDGKSGIPDIDAVADDDYDLAEFYRKQEFTVVETETGDLPPRGPFAIANCVGFVKAVLAIRSTAVTPWQLYRFLMRSG